MKDWTQLLPSLFQNEVDSKFIFLKHPTHACFHTQTFPLALDLITLPIAVPQCYFFLTDLNQKGIVLSRGKVKWLIVLNICVYFPFHRVNDEIDPKDIPPHTIVHNKYYLPIICICYHLTHALILSRFQIVHMECMTTQRSFAESFYCRSWNLFINKNDSVLVWARKDLDTGRYLC